MQVTIESREPVYEAGPEGEVGPYLYLFVRATVQDAVGTRSGPYYVSLPADATDAQVQAYIAGLFGA
jgi:hypothetical protein